MAEKLTRTSYVDVAGQPRQGTTALRESRVDVERYVRPLVAAHASALHGWGIGSGLGVSATAGAGEVTVSTGVAVDDEGRHLVVAAGGSVKLEDQALAPVTSAGAAVPTDGRTGRWVVTISWAETFDKAAYQANQVFQLVETPLVALRQEAGFPDTGAEVVLAVVELTDGKVTSLAVGTRRAAGVGVGRLEFRRAVADSPAAGAFSVRHVEAATLHVDAGDVLNVPAGLHVHEGATFSGASYGRSTRSSHAYTGERGNWSINSAHPRGWVSLQGQGGAVSIGVDVVPDHQPEQPRLVVHGTRSWRPSPGWPILGALSPPRRSALFWGDVEVIGTLRKSQLQFRIDHPDDPGAKYLNHAAVESDEMKNVYDGVVELDESGAAVVELPSWFEALNGGVRYQLTPIGLPAPNLHVAEKVSGGRFRIAGGHPGQEISWMLTGVRRDAYAVANPLVVEETKPHQEQGTFLHPEAHGEPVERSVCFEPPGRPAGDDATASPAGED